MRCTRAVLAGFDLKGYCEGSLALIILHGDLYSGVDVPFQTIHRRPDVLLDVKQLIDAHYDLFAIAILDSSFGLATWSARLE